MPLKRMTLVGLETYLNQLTSPKSISDNWVLENETFDKEVLLATIIRTGGRFEPLYADPEYFRTHCALWWKSYTRTFEKWFDVFDKTYEPLWNKDYFEKIHEDTHDSGSEATEHSQTTTVDDDSSYSKQGNDKTVEDDDNTLAESGTTKTVTDQDTRNTESGSTGVSGSSTLRAPGSSGSNSSTTTNSVSAYDSSSYQPKDQSVTNTNRSEDTTSNQTTNHGKIDTGTNDVTETVDHGKVLTGTDDKTTTRTWNESGSDADDSTTETEGTSATDRSNDRDFDRDAHMYGNIGVMSTQDLIKQEIEVQSTQLYQKIADLFCKDLLICVY